MKKHLALPLLSLTLGMVAGVLTQTTPLNTKDVSNESCEQLEKSQKAGSCSNLPENKYNPVFYPADYSTSIEDEPKFEDQKATTFDLMNFSMAPDNYRGDSVKVAVIDSGINYSHEDFGTINANSRTIDKTSGEWSYYPYASYESKLNDTMGHGTNVASVIASQINSVGCAGIAPNVDLYIYKVTNSEKGYEWVAINNALQYCIDNDIDVINMSFQAYEHPVTYNSSSMGASVGCSTVLNEMLKKCHDKGITLVGAAGNYNTNEPSYPASNDYVISVGSLADGSTTSKAGFSNTYDIDLVAPGYVHVADVGSSSSYKKTQGTSFSAPIVTAAIALYKQKNPDATPNDIEKVLYATCDSISGDPTWAGRGRLNIDRFLGLDGTSPQSISIDNIPSKEIELEVGDKLQLEYSVLPTTFEGTVEFSTYESGAISVSNTGLVTALEKGEDIVSINPVRYAYINDEISISVKERKKPEEINVISTSIAKTVSNGDQVVWGTSNTNCIKSIESNWGYLSNDETEFMVFSVETTTGGFYLKSNNKYVYSSAEKKISLSTSKTLLSINSTTGLITGRTDTTNVGTYVVNGNVRPYTSLGSYSKTYLYKVTKTSADTEYTVDFDPKGGSMGANPIGKTAYMGASITLPSIEKGGYTFAGWSTSSNATSADYNANYSLRITSNTKLYAVWVSNVADYIQDDYGSYYPSILESLSGDSLLSELHKLNNDKRIRTMGYDGLKTYGKYTEKDWTGLANKSGKMFGFYDNAYVADSWDNQATWNREHVWPYSLGGNKVEADMHMVRPASVSINSSRGNKFYGKNIYDPGEYEENYRGVAARIIFYSAIASTDLKLSDGTSASSDSNTMGKLSDLLEWNLQYLPNRSSNAPLTLRIEQNRNKEIFSRSDLQGNRNPFIDHPEYACKIWGNTNASTKEICGIGQQVTLSSITLSGNFQTSFNIGETFNYDNLVVTATYSDGSSKEVIPSSVSTPIMTTDGEKTVTVKYSENDVEVSSSYNINVKSSGGTTDPKNHTTALSLDEETATIKVGETVTLTATKTPSDSVDGINWSTSDPSVATVVNGVVTGVSVGTATITATSNDIPASCSVTVEATQSGDSITITDKSLKTSYQTSGANLTITVDGNDFTAYNLANYNNGMQFKSGSGYLSNNIGLSIDSIELVTKSGETFDGTLYWGDSANPSSTTNSTTAKNGNTYKNTSDFEYFKLITKSGTTSYLDKVIIHLKQAGPKVTDISLDKTKLSFDMFNDYSPKTLIATVTAEEGADETITWDSSNKTVATVVDGVVTPHSKGSTTITAKAGKKEATCLVTVEDSTPIKVKTITVSNAPTTIEATTYKDVSISVGPSNATDKSVTWASSSSAITISNASNTGARLTASGEAGPKATITITANDGSGVSASFEVTIVEKVVLTSIAWSGKTTYDVKSNLANNDGHLIYAYYSDGTEKNITSNTNVKITGFDSSEEQLNRVNVSYTEDGITKTTSQQLLILEGIGSGTSESYYEKVTSTADLTDGKYLIVYETGKVAFNGLLEALDAVKNTVAIGDISNGKITATETLDKAAFTYNASTGSFLGQGGKYFGNASDSNSITSSNTALTNTVSINNNNDVIIKSSGGACLRFNDGTDQARFRYYKSSSYTNQKDIQIYKYVEGQSTLTDEQNAKIYASSFVVGFTCDGSGKNSPTFASQVTWASLKSDYMKLTEKEKAFFVNATYNLYGSDVEETGDTNVVIAYAVARYDYVVAKYGYEDFMDRGIVSNRSNHIINVSNTEPTILITAITAMVGLAAIGGYFVYRRRREE